MLILPLKMINVINRNIMIRKYILNLYSKIVFNHLDNHVKLMFRKLETCWRKLITLELHLQFNIYIYMVYAYTVYAYTMQVEFIMWEFSAKCRNIHRGNWSLATYSASNSFKLYFIINWVASPHQSDCSTIKYWSFNDVIILVQTFIYVKLLISLWKRW